METISSSAKRLEGFWLFISGCCARSRIFVAPITEEEGERVRSRSGERRAPLYDC